jgi:neutral amino acid transport system ATP-binding protein
MRSIDEILPMALLEVHRLSKVFGGLTAVDHCDFEVEAGTIVSLIGPNGAGKTTAFNLVSGVLRPTSGEVHFDGHPIHGLQPHQITRRGLNRTFQISRVLDEMTVLENMAVHAHGRGLRRLLRRDISPAEREKAMALLEFVGIARLADASARELSYGQKKLLDFASQLMGEPRMIMLDEPAGGVNPALLETIVERIHELNRQGITFLIVEHNMDLVMQISDKVIVMAYGKVLASGKPSEVQQSQEVLDAYLGSKPL